MYFEQSPPGDLTSIVDCFWYAQSNQQVKLILPDGCQDWIFRYQQNLSASLIGSMTQAQSIHLNQPQIFFAIRFKPGALSLLHPIPMNEITNQDIELYDIFKLSNASRQALEIDHLDFQQFIKVMTLELRQRLKQADTQNLALVHYLRKTQQGQVQQTAESMKISRRQFQRLFNHHFGYSPRFYAKVMRFNQLVKQAKIKTESWAELALACGYFDQAHMNRDVKCLSGFTPAKLTKHLDVPNVQSID